VILHGSGGLATASLADSSAHGGASGIPASCHSQLRCHVAALSRGGNALRRNTGVTASLLSVRSLSNPQKGHQHGLS